MKLPRIKLNVTNAFNLVGIIVIIYLVVVLAGTLQRNYKLGRQIDDLNVQITHLNAEKDQLAYSIQYYNTDSFRDREARSKLGLQLPGENVVIIPRTSPTPAPAATNDKSKNKRGNFSQWLDFLGGRN